MNSPKRLKIFLTTRRNVGVLSLLFFSKKNKGVLIAFREALEIKVESIFHDKNGRYLILKTIIQNQPIVLANYYASNDEGSQISILSVMNEIINQLELDPDTAIVWVGDFNLIFDTNLDADGGKPQLKVNSLSKLSSITEENDLCDIFRVRCPNKKRFTW